MVVKDGNRPDAMRDRIRITREWLISEIRELDKAKAPSMVIYLLEMAKLECDDIVEGQGRHAH